MTDTPVPNEKKSLLKLLLGVLLRPRATFTYLRENQPRSWIVPALLIALCIMLPVFAGTSASQTITDPSMNMGMPGGAVVMPEGRVIVEGGGAPMPEMPAQPLALTLLQTAGALVSLPLTWLLWGGALYLASVFLGRSSGFAPMFRLTVWTWIPYAVRGLLQAVFIWTTGQAISNKGFAGYVLDSAVPQMITPGPGKLALAGILGRVDLFLVWNLILLVIGLMAFTKLPRRKALVAVLVIWAVFALLSIVPAILGGMFGSITM
jgi:hypothetical protein